MSKQDISKTLLPKAIKVIAKTAGLDLVSVSPLSGPIGSGNKSKNDAIKRNNKLSKISGGKILEEDTSNGSLFYLDFKYK